MKVLFLIDTLIGYGAERSLAEIVIRFKKIQPIVIHLHEGDQLKGKLQNNGVKVYSLNLKEKPGNREAIKLLKPIIKFEKPKIIHTTLFSSEMLGRRLKSLFPEILLVGSFVSNSYTKYRYNQLSFIGQLKLLSTQWRDKLTASSVDFFISNSKTIKFSNIKALGVNQDKIEVIYRGRYLSDYHNLEDQSVLREFHLQGKKVFLNVARLQQSKGQMNLLQAFRSFHATHSDSVLLIAGEGNFRKELEKFIEIHSLDNVVYLLGYRDDISQILALSDFFIFPSYYEGLPGAVIEAMLSETPVILSDIPENRECLPENTALFFEVGNTSEIERKMEEALKLKDWGARTKIAYDHACRYFDIEKVGEKYEEFYLNISVNS